VKKNNLISWQPGTSGNPKGRPKGSRNIKKVIQDLLDDRNMAARMSLRLPRDTETPLEAIIYTLMVKAMRGDIRAADVLLKYTVDRDEPAEKSPGFFDSKTIMFQVVDSNGNPYSDSAPEIDEETGTLVGYQD